MKGSRARDRPPPRGRRSASRERGPGRPPSRRRRVVRWPGAFQGSRTDAGDCEEQDKPCRPRQSKQGRFPLHLRGGGARYIKAGATHHGGEGPGSGERGWGEGGGGGSSSSSRPAGWDERRGSLPEPAPLTCAAADSRGPAEGRPAGMRRGGAGGEVGGGRARPRGAGRRAEAHARGGATVGAAGRCLVRGRQAAPPQRRS